MFKEEKAYRAFIRQLPCPSYDGAILDSANSFHHDLVERVWKERDRKAFWLQVHIGFYINLFKAPPGGIRVFVRFGGVREVESPEWVQNFVEKLQGEDVAWIARCKQPYCKPGNIPIEIQLEREEGYWRFRCTNIVVQRNPPD